MSIAVTERPFFALARSGKNSWARYLGAVALALVFLALVIVLIGVAFAILGGDPSMLQPDAATSPISNFLLLGASSIVMLGPFAAAIAIVHKKSPAAIIGAWSWRAYALGGALWFIVVALWTVVDYAVAPHGFHLNQNLPSLALIAVVIATLLVQTFAEEFIFRGYITQGLLLATKNELATALISGVIFGAMHIPNGWPQAVGATAMGVALAIIAIRTGGLAWTSGIHFANNLFGAIFVVAQTDIFRGSPSYIVQDTPELVWWDTLGLIVIIAAALFVLSRYQNRLAT